MQRRWEDIAKNGSFEYEFELRTWNAANRLKEHLERGARVEARDGEARTEILYSRKDGKDDLVQARAEQHEFQTRRRSEKKNDFPSPFDPTFRADYSFSETFAEGSLETISFQPRSKLANAVSGTAEFDALGKPRRVVFTLARPPIFTRNLIFAISLDEEGNPVRVESSGEVSLVVWKRRFESTVRIHDVVPAAVRKEKS